VKVRRRELTLAEKIYFPSIVKGLGNTFKHLFDSLILRKFTTMQYPEERHTLPAGYRGVPVLVKDEDGRGKCVACSMCEYVCPSRAISIIPKQIDTTVEKAPDVFDIDMLRCIFCGYCEEVCPEEAIFMSPEHEICGRTREEMVYGIDKLYELGAATVGKDGGVESAVKKWENKDREAAAQRGAGH
jgi:NADH-quinone oxidoreductase subunit I